MPITRLPQDTVDIVQPAFYPNLAFQGLAGPGDRYLDPGVAGATAADRLLDRCLNAGSLSMIALPQEVLPVVDPRGSSTSVTGPVPDQAGPAALCHLRTFASKIETLAVAGWQHLWRGTTKTISIVVAPKERSESGRRSGIIVSGAFQVVRPAAYLDTYIRSGSSSFWAISNAEAGLQNLRRDLETGEWERRYAELLTLDEYDAGYRLVVAD